MHLTTAVAAYAALAISLVATVPTPATQYNVHEKRGRKPIMWEKGERVHGEMILPVRIGLMQSNLDVGATLLEEM